MIRHLHIRNYAIIEVLDIEFSPHLTIITGETGAGKSIMLGALGLIMGNRADLRVLYQQEQKCIITATFDISAYNLRGWLEANDLDYDPEIILRREITPAGKSRAYVNDQPVTLDVLRALSEQLLDLHQQFDTLDIHEANFQLQVVDALAGNKALLHEYEQHYRQYASDQRQLEQLLALSRQANKEADFVQFQLKELRKAALQTGELEALEQELAVLTHAEEIKQLLIVAFRQLIDDEMAVTNQLREALQHLNQAARLRPDLQVLRERLDSCLHEIADIGSECEQIAEDTEHDPERLAEVQDRLNQLYRLLKKHAVAGIAELQTLQRQLEAQAAQFTDVSEQIVACEQRIRQHEQTLRHIGANLSKRRTAVIATLEEQVQQQLQLLSMEHARLVVELTPDAGIGATGTDRVRFLFSANKGSRLEEIKGTASGGELSRLTLVVKALVASAIPLPTLIFDEIDSGVSGEVALRMGQILQQLSLHHQIVAITHSPQVAAQADRHYFVYKQADEQRTLTRVRLLSREERITEIAKMLSGNPPSEAARLNAAELLQKA